MGHLSHKPSPLPKLNDDGRACGKMVRVRRSGHLQWNVITGYFKEVFIILKYYSTGNFTEWQVINTLDKWRGLLLMGFYSKNKTEWKLLKFFFM